MFDVIYPDLCYACLKHIPLRGRNICFSCLADFPYTEHFEKSNNLLSNKLWGRFDFTRAASLIYLHKGSPYKEMIHRLKYEGHRNTGLMLGRIAANRMLRFNAFDDIDVIVPVPIHKARKAVRGYNQSTQFALGISEIKQLPIYEDVLIKRQNNSSQVDKSRYQRLDNVIDTFHLTHKAHHLRGVHFLLVDDVITTGATIEACALRLLEIPSTRVSILSIAQAR